jgi:hypothetical protein
MRWSSENTPQRGYQNHFVWPTRGHHTSASTMPLRSYETYNEAFLRSTRRAPSSRNSAGPGMSMDVTAPTSSTSRLPFIVSVPSVRTHSLRNS